MKVYLDIEPQIETHPDESGDPYQELVDEIVRYFFIEGKDGFLFEYSKAGMPLSFEYFATKGGVDFGDEITIDQINIPKQEMIRVIYE